MNDRIRKYEILENGIRDIEKSYRMRRCPYCGGIHPFRMELAKGLSSNPWGVTIIQERGGVCNDFIRDIMDDIISLKSSIGLTPEV